eukprot:3815504-Prorocentrum_lima.AAC.1
MASWVGRGLEGAARCSAGVWGVAGRHDQIGGTPGRSRSDTAVGCPRMLLLYRPGQTTLRSHERKRSCHHDQTIAGVPCSDGALDTAWKAGVDEEASSAGKTCQEREDLQTQSSTFGGGAATRAMFRLGMRVHRSRNGGTCRAGRRGQFLRGGLGKDGAIGNPCADNRGGKDQDVAALTPGGPNSHVERLSRIPHQPGSHLCDAGVRDGLGRHLLPGIVPAIGRQLACCMRRPLALFPDGGGISCRGRHTPTLGAGRATVSYTHLRAHETRRHL